MSLLETTDPAAREDALEQAAAALARGDLVVLPTDTVYGLAADAFDPEAVRRLLAAKGRGRDQPPPVLVSGPDTLHALATDVPPEARTLTEALWPGALTVILRARPTLVWDLGETSGTVALRMPDHPVALDLLRRAGPLAVSSANLTARPPALTGAQARDQLGESVAVYLEDGPAPGGVPSTIVDLTHSPPRILRSGAVSVEQLAALVPAIGTGQ